MPRPPRLRVPGSTVHVVARCNNREFLLAEDADFAQVRAALQVMGQTFGVVLYAYTVMANHVHLLLQAPPSDPLARPLRWFMTQAAKALNRRQGRTGHCWEQRYHACVVEDDTYALAALRYLDRNPVRAGLVQDPVTYPWSSCAAYTQGTADPLITLHPSYLALSAYPRVRQRKYRQLLQPGVDPLADGRDPRWTTTRAVGSPAFLARHRLRPPSPRSPLPPQ
jgi:putative transposase